MPFSFVQTNECSILEVTFVLPQASGHRAILHSESRKLEMKKIKCQVVSDKCQKSSKSEILTCDLFMPIGISFLMLVAPGKCW